MTSTAENEASSSRPIESAEESSVVPSASSSSSRPTSPSLEKAVDETPAADEDHEPSKAPSAATAPSSPLPKPTKRSTLEELRRGLRSLGLDIKGTKATVYKRFLRAWYKSEEAVSERESTPDNINGETPALAQTGLETYEARLRAAQETWKSFLCFDVEATCRGGKEFDWPNEIIEFPVVLVQWVDDPSSPGGKSLQHVDTFHSYVQPTWQPQLTDFCVALTGITQEMVDQSPKFPQMIELLEQWLDKHDLRDEDGRLKNAMWVTDGPWDLRDFVPKQLFISPTNPLYPMYLYGQYLNIKQAVQTVLGSLWQDEQASKAAPAVEGSDTPNTSDETSEEGSPAPTAAVAAVSPPRQAATTSQIISTNKTMSKTHRETKYKGPNFYFPIPGQLSALGLGEFEGRQHSGVDDATNVARILIALSQKPNVILEPNARASHPKQRRYPWMGPKPGQVIYEEWMSNAKAAMVDGKEGRRSFDPKDGRERVGAVEEEKKTEWVLKQDARGLFVCVKEEVGGGGAGVKREREGEVVEGTAGEVAGADEEMEDAEVDGKTKAMQSFGGVEACEAVRAEGGSKAKDEEGSQGGSDKVEISASENGSGSLSEAKDPKDEGSIEATKGTSDPLKSEAGTEGEEHEQDVGHSPATSSA